MGRIGFAVTAATLVAALGCGGATVEPVPPPPEEALLALEPEGKACRLDLIVIPGAVRHTLATVPKACEDWELMLSKDGARVLLPRSRYVVDIADRKATALPDLKGVNGPNQVDEQLHFDAQGLPVWEITQGEGKANHEGDFGPVYPVVRSRWYALREGTWVQRAELVQRQGQYDPAEVTAFRTKGQVEEHRLHRMGGEVPGAAVVTDPALREALEVASGAKPEEWYWREPLAWTASDQGEAGTVMDGPVLIRLDGQWRVLPSGKNMSLGLELRDRWLRIAGSDELFQVVDIATGEVGWSGVGPAVFWPEGVPLPAL